MSRLFENSKFDRRTARTRSCLIFDRHVSGLSAHDEYVIDVEVGAWDPALRYVHEITIYLGKKVQSIGGRLLHARRDKKVTKNSKPNNNVFCGRSRIYREKSWWGRLTGSSSSSREMTPQAICRFTQSGRG